MPASQELTPQLFVNTATKLLLHFDGDLSDSSGYGNTATAAGSAAVDATTIFSAGSLGLTADSDCVLVNNVDCEFGTGDFCIDLRVRLASASHAQVLYNGGINGPRIRYDGAALKFESAAGTITGSGLAADTNYHIALTRAAGSTRLWRDGVQQGSTLPDTTYYRATPGYPFIGGVALPQALAPSCHVNTQGFFTPVVANVATATFVAHGVQFDGNTDYFINRGSFTGLTDSKSGTLSMWINVPADPGTTFLYLFGWQAGDFSSAGFLIRNLNTFMQLIFYGSGGQIGTISPNSGFGSPAGLPPDSTSHTWRGAGWRWLGFSWDFPAGRMQCASNMYVPGGGPDWFDGSSISDNAVVYPTNGFPFIGSYGFLNNPWQGDLAEFMFWGGTSLDLYDTATMRKLITATGHPADVGTDGSAVTGFLPTWYFKGPALGFGTNAAGTGDMIVLDGTGVTDSPTDP